MARLLLENIVAENRLDKIRIIDVDNYVVGGQPNDDIDGTFTSSESARDLACTAKYTLDELLKLSKGLDDHSTDTAAHKDIRSLVDLLWNNLKLANPVGMLGNSVDAKVFNSMWLSLNGEYISRTNYTALYDYLLGLGYVPNAQQLIQLPDARALVFRSQNKGRFPDVTEIGIGQYQADATQKTTGYYNWLVMDATNGGAAVGVFRVGTLSDRYVPVTFSSSSIGSMPTRGLTYDNALMVRTALEERVKAIGVHAQIFVGFSDKLKVLA